MTILNQIIETTGHLKNKKDLKIVFSVEGARMLKNEIADRLTVVSDMYGITENKVYGIPFSVNKDQRQNFIVLPPIRISDGELIDLENSLWGGASGISTKGIQTILKLIEHYSRV